MAFLLASVFVSGVSQAIICKNYLCKFIGDEFLRQYDIYLSIYKGAQCYEVRVWFEIPDGITSALQALSEYYRSSPENHSYINLYLNNPIYKAHGKILMDTNDKWEVITRKGWSLGERLVNITKTVNYSGYYLGLPKEMVRVYCDGDLVEEKATQSQFNEKANAWISEPKKEFVKQENSDSTVRKSAAQQIDDILMEREYYDTDDGKMFQILEESLIEQFLALGIKGPIISSGLPVCVICRCRSAVWGCKKCQSILFCEGCYMEYSKSPVADKCPLRECYIEKCVDRKRGTSDQVVLRIVDTQFFNYMDEDSEKCGKKSKTDVYNVGKPDSIPDVISEGSESDIYY